ncbi:sensor domain-containing diguanylate cyclase [Comamonas jiangduensis]|uniref:Diguanylate cyclase domain-containing protein n=1 Tax=Comamonas jiangduensis TaxID=1194168 RepID=A0ABV4IEF3_9BURK
MMDSLATGLDFEDMFNLAPVSLWMEDYSELKRLFDQWRAEGITDLLAFLQADTSRLARCSAAFKVLRVNQYTLELFQAPDQATLQSRLGEVFRDAMLDKLMPELLALWDGQMRFENRSINYDLRGNPLNVQIRGQILPGYEHCWSRVLVSLEDITAEVRSTEQLQRSEHYARDLFEYSPVSLWVEDFREVKRLLDEVRSRGISDFKTFLKVHPEFVTRCMQEIRVIDVNQQTLKMFGAHSKHELMQNLRQIFRGEMYNSFAEQLQDLWDGKLVQQREVVNYALSGDLLHIHLEFSVMSSHASDWGLVLLSLVDITARKKAEAYLEYLGKHDVLTQLRNRAFYSEELNRLTRKGPWPVSVIALDMNGLKAINDEHGHAAGDAMLRRIGEVLSKAVDAPDCAARIGGDEFMVLMPGTDERGVQAMQERIASLLELNNQFYAGQPIHMAMGSTTGHEGTPIENVVHRADQAMYAEKVRFYQSRTHFFQSSEHDRRIPPSSEG